MELDWYSKKHFSSNYSRRVAALTRFIGHVGSSLMLVKPLYKRLSSSISSKSLPASTHCKKWDDYDDFLDFQPKCVSLGRSRKWAFPSLDERAGRKQHNCFACVLHI
uniref:Uncharacterized protein n=1 Tax=Physcomitrium patens TaxID=3218 RepID=A0A2K1J4N1_PHYPA|nr:hypothetical protein PHYPA_022311 [Physcomitrium patens]